MDNMAAVLFFLSMLGTSNAAQLVSKSVLDTFVVT